MLESSTNLSSADIWNRKSDNFVYFFSQYVILSKMLYGIEDVDKSAILSASLSIISHKE